MANLENQEAINSLLSGIEYIVDQKINKAPFTRIKNGRVEAILDDGFYSVNIEGATYKIQSIDECSVNVGDIVKVAIMQNDYSSMFIVSAPRITLGTTDLVSGVSPLASGTIYLVYE